MRTVVIFGAGGPLAAAAVHALAPCYRLRLTDIRPLAAIVAEARPQVPGAPLPTVPEPPHETMVVDVTDPAQVGRACEGMDAIINGTVVRSDPVQAFRVNCLGAYHVMQAAVKHAIRRLVHTGPQLVNAGGNGEYWFDFGVPEDTAPRPGTTLYFLTKYLGLEVVRSFAEQHALSVPVLLFGRLVHGVQAMSAPAAGRHPFIVSWRDAGAAIKCAVEVANLPRACEVFHIVADLPQGKYPNTKAKRLLGWHPREL
ncbi:MAG: NAD-dependent epimerase/dehydratase family protein [Chloroflexota bacterium]